MENGKTIINMVKDVNTFKIKTNSLVISIKVLSKVMVFTNGIMVLHIQAIGEIIK